MGCTLFARVAVAALVVMAGCSAEGLAFRVDERVDVVAPEDDALVEVPVTVRWTAEGIRTATATQPGASFLVLVDRAPPSPGRTVQSMVDDEPDCRGTQLAACLTPEALARRGIYTTTATELQLTTVPVRLGMPADKRDEHEVTVALLDEAGKRDGESAFRVTFRVRT
ncbi:MAG TPA: hypothetical protein VM938_00685 [Acidimicrobiales bacterium]|nr:hypothetical protein [Acidimicrobiales bacterium]